MCDAGARDSTDGTSPQLPAATTTLSLQGGVDPSSDVSPADGRTDTTSTPTTAPAPAPAAPAGSARVTVIVAPAPAYGPMLTHAPEYARPSGVLNANTASTAAVVPSGRPRTGVVNRSSRLSPAPRPACPPVLYAIAGSAPPPPAGRKRGVETTPQLPVT